MKTALGPNRNLIPLTMNAHPPKDKSSKYKGTTFYSARAQKHSAGDILISGNKKYLVKATGNIVKI